MLIVAKLVIKLQVSVRSFITERCRHWWEDNFKTFFKKIGLEVWTDLILVRAETGGRLSGSIEGREFLDYLSVHLASKKYLVCGGIYKLQQLNSFQIWARRQSLLVICSQKILDTLAGVFGTLRHALNIIWTESCPFVTNKFRKQCLSERIW
jgi:hypothetical protein